MRERCGECALGARSELGYRISIWTLNHTQKAQDWEIQTAISEENFSRPGYRVAADIGIG